MKSNRACVARNGKKKNLEKKSKKMGIARQQALNEKKKLYAKERKVLSVGTKKCLSNRKEIVVSFPLRSVCWEFLLSLQKTFAFALFPNFSSFAISRSFVGSLSIGFSSVDAFLRYRSNSFNFFFILFTSLLFCCYCVNQYIYRIVISFKSTMLHRYVVPCALSNCFSINLCTYILLGWVFALGILLIFHFRSSFRFVCCCFSIFRIFLHFYFSLKKGKQEKRMKWFHGRWNSTACTMKVGYIFFLLS